jgi:sigma-B regulation protein RsbU (phosphoserine phosphatase)
MIDRQVNRANIKVKHTTMPICYIGCDAPTTQQIISNPEFSDKEVLEVEFPITATNLQIDLLIVGPKIENLIRLAATISDWNLPPVALLILPEATFAKEVENLSHHPRVGRSIFFCKDTAKSVQHGLQEVYAFYRKRDSLELDNSFSGNFNLNNISPRWLFQTMMEHLDEYIYFKDRNSRFLAVSRYLVESCGKSDPSEIIGHTDFEFFDTEHAQEAYEDERKIATGVSKELNKEEHMLMEGEHVWVASRKLPLYTRSNYLAGSFGLSRDITEQKELNQELKKNHQRMEAELLLARNLQSALIQDSVPTFVNATGVSALQIATEYIPSFHLSGDFFSVNKTTSGGAAILIADVMGHGVRAAMVTAMIQIAVNELHAYAEQPADFMMRLNSMMHESMHASGQTIFATASYCYLNLESRQLSYIQAGARHGIYTPADPAQYSRVFDGKHIGPALGLLAEVEYTEDYIELNRQDEIILYTDGVIEAAMNEEEYSEARMLHFLETHRNDDLPQMIAGLIDSVQSFTDNKGMDDDVCLIGLRVL